MGRKAPRSQQRKKGKSMEGGDTDDDKQNDRQQFLDEDFTIAADSVSHFSDWGSIQTDITPEDDFYLEGGKDHIDSAVAAAESRYVKLKETLLLTDEFASEKRSVKREQILKRLFKALSQHATGPGAAQLVYEWSDAIRNASFHGLRVGTPPEQYAACRVLEVTSVVLGADQDEWCDSLQRQLKSTIQTTQRAVPVRVAALRALAMSVFVCASESIVTEGLMDLCELVAAKEYRKEPVSASLRATALDCWALLATTLMEYHLAGQDDVQMGRGLAILELLRDCLEDSSVDLRSAAGECVTLIHEARLNLGCDDEEENTTARRYRRGSWDGSPWEVTMDEVKQRIAELSVESSHHLSRKAKKEQRATFREFMATIVEDEAPEEVVAFRGGRLTMHSWKEIIQLNFVRHCLQGGFQIQILTNETLHLIFGANGQLLMENSTLSQLEKRLTLSKTSEGAKAADLDLKANRKKRQNIKNHFLTADGEDL